MRPRISIRGFVPPSVRPSVRRSVGNHFFFQTVNQVERSMAIIQGEGRGEDASLFVPNLFFFRNTKRIKLVTKPCRSENVGSQSVSIVCNPRGDGPSTLPYTGSRFNTGTRILAFWQNCNSVTDGLTEGPTERLIESRIRK